MLSTSEDEPAGRSVIRRALVPLAVGLIAVFLVATVIALVGDLPSIDWQIQVGWLALALVGFVAFQGIQGEMWRVLLRDAGGPIDRLDGWRIFAVGLLARYVPTSILMLVTRMKMCSTLGVARSVTLASFAYELVLVVGAGLAISCGFLLGRPEISDSPLKWLLVVAPVALFALLHPKVIDRVAHRLAAQLGEEPSHSTIPVRRLLAVAVGYGASFAAAGLAMYAFGRGISPIGPMTWSILTAYAVGWVAAFLAFFIPGGLGARDVATATALSASMPFSVALAVAIGTRLMQTGVELGWAGTTAALEHRRGRHQLD